MERIKKIIQIISSIIIGLIVANIFESQTMILQFVYTIIVVLVVMAIIEFIFVFFKK